MSLARPESSVDMIKFLQDRWSKELYFSQLSQIVQESGIFSLAQTIKTMQNYSQKMIYNLGNRSKIDEYDFHLQLLHARISEYSEPILKGKSPKGRSESRNLAFLVT